MTEPQTLAQNRPSLLARLMAGIAEHCPDVTAAPLSDEPTPDEPGHPEYHRRQRATFAFNRWRTAVPHRYREATATHPDVLAWADRAATDIRDAGFLVLTGSIGTGKTHQAYGALRRIAEAGPRRFEMIATTAPDMYGRLRPGGSAHGTEHELKRLCRVPLLLLDDLGTEKLSEWTEEATYRLINERYNQCLPLVVTTNFPVRAAPDETGRPSGPDLVSRLGDRLASRLAQTASIVRLDGPDLRRQLRSAA
ncbi:putative helicase loader [Streptomyces sp. NBRC 110611]|uniref:ATP-binding protein n=1 Tax=Streptomyces sp. NBRC 110611 TaxID=1621259 RepID=UPI000832879E|nr:ATP-binding protein [Streptomyces sp. NBRC 110611]GAU66679.1 putative helicase loader [Streptomyces sp. NBRC 110611]